ncbi:MAG: PTS sugar transporter subunit IIA [Alphaproteobacteria bacterium]|nr:PTS sugar transporter subunit IIA [Alphaproteobacteria bacterium]
MTNQYPDFTFDFFHVETIAIKKNQILSNCAKAIAALPQLRTLMSAKKLENELAAPEIMENAVLGGGALILSIRIEGLKRPFIGLIHTKTPLDFSAADGLSCDILCIVACPEQEPIPTGLQRLSRITRFLRDKKAQDRIRIADRADVLQALMVAADGWLLAA